MASMFPAVDKQGTEPKWGETSGNTKPTGAGPRSAPQSQLGQSSSNQPITRAIWRGGHCPSLAPSCFCGKSGAENGHVRQAPIPTRHTHTHAHVCTHAHACARAHTHNSDARISSKPGKAGASGPGENAVRGVGRSRRGFAGHEGVKCRSVCRLALRRQRGPEWLCPGTPTPESQLLRAPGRVPLSSWTGGQPRSQGKQCPWLLSPPPQAGSLPPRPTPPRRPPPGPSPPHGEARHSHSLHASCEMSLFSPPV